MWSRRRIAKVAGMTKEAEEVWGAFREGWRYWEKMERWRRH